MKSLFQPGRNCAYAAQARRAKVLIDADAYFRAFARTAERAEKSIIILAWDFDTRTPLAPGENHEQPALVGDFLNYLVDRRPALRIFILNWDYPMIFGTDREFPPVYGLGWKPRRGIHLHYDNTHPVGGSHHQKVVVIDDAVAFSGGLDLTSRRWDTCEHRAHEPRRCVDGTPYPPFHDLMAMVDGEAARGVAAIARARWRQATGKKLPRAKTQNDPWPVSVVPELTDVTVGISRTMPPNDKQPPVREIEALYLDMIASAKHHIYIENQYFTAPRLSAALSARLAERAGPELVIVLRLLSHGWLEEHTMHALRTRLIRQLRAADRWNRCGIYYAHTEGLREGTCIDLHSKAMLVDDEYLRIGSANLCNRSMGMDSECDLTFEARGNSRTASTIRDLRNRLLGEHLDVAPEQVQSEYARSGSLNHAIAALQSGGRTLKPLNHVPDVPDIMIEVASVADPERPVSLEKLIDEFAPIMPAEPAAPAWGMFIWIALLLAGLTMAWRFTPLADLITPDNIIGFARNIGSRWWAPLVVMAAYTPACLVMFPRPLITLFSVMAFGPWLAFLYALIGILLSALVTYVAGLLLSRDTVRRLGGSKLNRISEVLRKRGLLAITMLRLVPVAPFSVEGLVAGALRIKLWHFMLGTAIGLLPGTLATTIFGDQLETALRDPSQINYWLLATVVALFAAAIWSIRRYVFDGAFLHAPRPRADNS